jgi:hypothetical protein
MHTAGLHVNQFFNVGMVQHTVIGLNFSHLMMLAKVSGKLVAAQPRGGCVDHHILCSQSAAYVCESHDAQSLCGVTSHTLYGLIQQWCDGMLIVLYGSNVCDQDGLSHSSHMRHCFSGDTGHPDVPVRYGVIHV